MFSNALIAFLVAISGGTWIYNKLMKQTGNNTKNSIIGAAISAGVIFLVVVTLVGMVSHR